MRIHFLTLPVLAIWFATILALPAGLRAQEMDNSADSPLMEAVQQVIALQESWMDEHQCYGSTYDLAEYLNGQVLNDDIFPASGGVIHQFLAVDSQAYILLARDPAQWQYITAASSGELFQGRSSEPYQSAVAAVAALVWAENAMFANYGHYAALGELRNAGFLGEHWTPFMEVKSGEIVLLSAGAVLTLSAHSTTPLYDIIAESGTGSIYANNYRTSIEQDELNSDYSALLLEKARNCLRTVISANAAHYANYGEYNTLPLLAERRYLHAKFGDSDPADLNNGIRMFVLVQDSGQAYHAVIAVQETMYYGSETGEIREYPVDEPIDNPEIEALRLQVKDLME